MKKILFIGFLFGLMSVLISCSSNNNKHNVVGVWELTTRTVHLPFDVNRDGVFHTNLIEEIECNKSETLTFKTDGTVFSGNEFSTEYTYFMEDSTDIYRINVVCNTDGVISFASEYEIIDKNTVKLSHRTYTVNQDTLTTVYENAVNIYNENLTEIIDTKDLVLIYTKQ